MVILVLVFSLWQNTSFQLSHIINQYPIIQDDRNNLKKMIVVPMNLKTKLVQMISVLHYHIPLIHRWVPGTLGAPSGEWMLQVWCLTFFCHFITFQVWAYFGLDPVTTPQIRTKRDIKRNLVLHAGKVCKLSLGSCNFLLCDLKWMGMMTSCHKIMTSCW